MFVFKHLNLKLMLMGSIPDDNILFTQYDTKFEELL